MTEDSNKKDCKYFTLVVASYITMFFFGVIENVKSVTFVLIKDLFHASYDAQGYLVSVSWYGYVIFCLVCAFVVDRFGIKTAIVSGHVLCVLGCIITPFMTNFVTIIIALMVVWMGFGFFEVGYNSFATVLFTENSAIYLNLMHFNYAFGAIVGPQIASWLVSLLKDSYKGVYKALAGAMFVMLVATSVISFDPVKKRQAPTQDVESAGKEKPKSELTVWRVFGIPYVWLCSITLGFMEVIEFGASNWGALYYRDVYGLDVTKEGALFVSMFYTLFAIARLFSGWVIEKLGYYTSLFASLVIVVVIYVMGFLCGVHGRWIIPFTGYFIGIMFPTYMCVLMKIFGDDASIISSVVIFLSGATNGLIQLVIGYINEYMGNEWGFRFNVVYTVIPFILLMCVKRLSKRYVESSKKDVSVEMATLPSETEKTVSADTEVKVGEVKAIDQSEEVKVVDQSEEVKAIEQSEVKMVDQSEVKENKESATITISEPNKIPEASPESEQLAPVTQEVDASNNA